MRIVLSRFAPGMAGEAITHLHQRLVLLGLEVPAAELQDDRYGPGTEAAISRFQSVNGLQVSGAVDDATARGLGLGGYPDTITGVVCRPDGTLLGDVAVRLFQQLAGGEKLVAETQSAMDGKFSFPWPSGVSGGLIVRASGSSGHSISWKSVASSGATWIRLCVGGEYRGPSRFALLTAALAPVFENAALHTLGGARQDSELESLGEAAGVPSRDVSRHVLAHKLAVRTQLDPAVFFALLTHQLPATPPRHDLSAAAAESGDEAQIGRALDLALRQPLDDLRATLRAAVADNVVADLDVDATARQLHELQVERVAQQPLTWQLPLALSSKHACCALAPEEGRSLPDGDGDAGATRAALSPVHVHRTPLRDVVATALPDGGVQRRVLEALAALDSSARLASVVDRVPELSAEQRADVAFALEAAVLLANHLPLIEHAQKLRAAGVINSPSDLAQLDETEWASLLRDVDPGAEHIDQLAGLFAQRFEIADPTTALAARLAKDRGATSLVAADRVQRFLGRSPGFCIRHTHIDRFLHDMARDPAIAASDAPFEDADREQVVSDLKVLQRAYKLTPRFHHVKAMLAAGHGSSHSIHATGLERFTAQLTSGGVPEADATAIFGRAQQVHATALTLLGNFHSAFTSATPLAVAAPPASDALAATLADFPTLQTLFGSVDYCACADCRAIHGPAAYLVDILQFLASRPSTDADHPFARDVLLNRRPDLAQIELSCANTNGIMPYIDLVCEILEDAVGSAPEVSALRARQTSGTTEELRANPAFVRESAYVALRDASFPLSGPFDLFASEVRAYLRQLGVPRHELMAAFMPASPTNFPQAPSDAQVTGERFGLTSAALTIITTAAPAAPWALWGLTAANNAIPDPRKPDDPSAIKRGTWDQILAFVPILLHRAQLQHRELVQLLQTRFINPSGAVRIVQAGVNDFATCDTGQQTVQGWTSDLLTRFNRFIRLWRQLGCTIWDLDKALDAIGDDKVDDNAIVQLGRLDAIARRLDAPWDELLTLWGDLDRFDYINVLDGAEPVVPSVYRRRFRSASVTQASTVFVENPGALTGTLENANTVAGISAALGIAADDIRRIRTAASLSSTTAPLNLANLSAIARYAIFAERLELSISELLSAIAVIGLNPFAGTLAPARTLQFLAGIDQIRDSGFTLAELSYLLRHEAVVDSGIGLADATIISWLEDLRRALVRLGTSSTAAVTELVAQRISAALPLDIATTQQVLQAVLPGGTSTIGALFTAPALTVRASDGSFSTATSRANFSAIFDAYTALDKLRSVLARWRVTTTDALWLLQHASQAGWLALHSLPVSAVAAQTSSATLAAFDTLRQNVIVQQTLASPSGERLFDFVLSPGSTVASAVQRIAPLGGWASTDIVALANRLGLTTPGSLVAGATVARIRDLMAWPRKLGADVPTTLTFAERSMASAETQKARQLTRSRFTNEQWLGVSGSIQDRLRDQKRAALVAWLLAHPSSGRGQKWSSVEDLYGFYLIDPEMSAAATTTRIKQAAASVQLFVQRCLLQLEPDVTVDVDTDSVWKQWDWMKRFRIWEANRKIFLYPENWFDPGQRRDMSSYFADLVADLQQTDLTNDVAEEALRAYLHKLADVAHLEVSGIWEEPVDDQQSILHVVARTRKTPYVYSYRRREASGTWSPWEPLDPGVDTNHVMPAIWNKRLFMLWTEFTEKSLPTKAADRTVPIGAPASPPLVAPEPTRYLEVALAWLERRNNRWLPKRVSQRKQLITMIPKREVVFRIFAPERRLELELYKPTVQATGIPEARWTLTSAQDEPILTHTERTALGVLEEMRYIGPAVPSVNPAVGARPRLGSANMTWHFNAYGGDNPDGTGALALQRVNPDTSVQLRTALSTISRARVISVRFGELDQFYSPFFVSDPQRTFFALDSSWRMQTFYHPFVETFVQRLNRGGIPGLYDRTLQTNPDLLRGTPPFNFTATYAPSEFVTQPYPTEAIDYSPSGPYSVYNWELFLHTPLLIAKRLADNQRFEEALRWLHYIFNPTTVSGGEVPQRYWNPRVFRDLLEADYQQQQIEQLLRLVNEGDDEELLQRVTDWRNNPFDPNLVAAARPVAYQKAVVMQYISTLIAWGDQLFRGDTIESINEATQLYLLASQLLGPRPQNVRAIQPRQNLTYDQLKDQLDAFSNAAVGIENIVSVPPPGVTVDAPTPSLETFYFCIPPNDQMLGYWDTVSDRLFKVRHGLNLEGVARPLALYEPPIDPGLLVRAAAAGVDISAAVADAAVPLGCYRFSTLWQVAHDLCQDVRGLGAAILSALERRDGEEIARLRSTQEVAVLDSVRAIKLEQLREANENKAALESSREMAIVRRDYYASRQFVNPAEIVGLGLGGFAVLAEIGATIADTVAGAAHVIPTVTAGASGFGGTPTLTLTHGGGSVGNSAASFARALHGAASVLNQGASLANTVASYQRRRDEWQLQQRLAEREIVQLDRQLIAADLRIAIARREVDLQIRQINDARANAELLHTKFTNKELYDWMLSQLSSTYFHAYQLAYDLAKRASRGYSFELGVADPGFIQFGYWDSLHKGLVAGDKLLLDLRRLQAEHLHQNKRELEITKHVSLLEVDPSALVTLRQTGACFFQLPEALFDGDQPGHYLRRIKSVSVTLPCVTGPYVSTNATLTLLSHSTRMSTSLGGGYPAATDPSDGLPFDARFSHIVGAAQSIALSTGREDAGMFEVSLRDERYLPFEGVGAISSWRLELPKDTNRFDLSTLSDVVLHVRYTARDGGQALRDAARAAVITVPPPRGGVQLLSARSEFPDAWARLFAPVGTDQSLSLALGAQYFPFISTTHQINLTAVKAILLFTDDSTYEDYLAVAPNARLNARLGFTPSDGTHPTASVTFTALTATMGGIPVAGRALTGPVAPLTIAFREADIAAAPLLDSLETSSDGTSHHRLNSSKIDDILLLVDYQVVAES